MALDFDFARSVIKSEADAIGAMVRVVDESFASAAEIIFNSTGSVIVTGVGKAGIIGEKISATLASTGTPSHFLHPVEALHGDLGRVQTGDVVLALSHSGESDEIIRLINPIKQQEIKLIAGPLYVNHPYKLEREIIALSESRRTESMWIKTSIIDAQTNVLVAETILNSATMKDSYAGYEAEAKALGKNKEP